VALVAGLARREVFRRPGAWFATLLTGVLFAGLLLLVGVVTDRVQERAEDRSFRIAVGGDLDGAADFLARLEQDERLVLRDDDDPFDEVVGQRAAVGLVVPEGLDAAVADGRTVELALSYRTTSAVSTEALTTLLVDVQQLDTEALLETRAVAAPSADTAATRSEGGGGGGPLTLAVESVVDDARVARIRLSREIGAVSALLCLGLVTSVAGVLGAARERRAVEPLLVLPLRRSSLTTGMALGTLPMGALQIVAGIALLVATAAVPGSTARQEVAVLAAMFVGGLAAAFPLALLGCACGSLAGAMGTGTDDAVGLGDLLSVPFVVTGLALFATGGVPGSVALCSVPILGQALLVREAVAGTASVAQATAAVVSALVTSGVLLAAAGRLVGDERRLLRATR
jgi:ABC-type Na+ efflux pump permease subunit